MSEELTKSLANDDLSRILALLNSMNERLATLEDKVARLDSKVDRLEDKVDRLEEKVDRRLQETRPIWEQVLARLDSLDSRVENLETEVRTGFRRLERQMGLLSGDVIAVRPDQRDLERRMDKLESETAR